MSRFVLSLSILAGCFAMVSSFETQAAAIGFTVMLGAFLVTFFGLRDS